MTNDNALNVASEPNGVAVYCAASLGQHKAYQLAAISLGRAIAAAGRPLIYGGGASGLMGVVSGAARQAGGRVVGVRPYAMVAAGGENVPSGVKETRVGREAGEALEERAEDEGETVVVPSMHERKVEMTRRAMGFVGLPGGYGTLEEVMEAVTWTQLGIHNKPIVLLNVLDFYTPLRAFIQSAVAGGLVQPQNEALVVFVDGPAQGGAPAHEAFDWGGAALAALDAWKRPEKAVYFYDWTRRMPGGPGQEEGRQTPLESS